MRVSPTQGDVQMRTCHQLFWGACSLRTRKLRRSAVDPRLYNPWLLGLRRPIDSDPCMAEMLRYRNFFFPQYSFYAGSNSQCACSFAAAPLSACLGIARRDVFLGFCPCLQIANGTWEPSEALQQMQGHPSWARGGRFFRPMRTVSIVRSDQRIWFHG